MDNFRAFLGEVLPAVMAPNYVHSTEQQATLTRWAEELAHLKAHRDAFAFGSQAWHEADYSFRRASTMAVKDFARQRPGYALG
ncbi:MAG: hypothetical protein ACRYFK_16820 [Janthinobacterium lividum]